uniref:Tyrosine-protein kinase n=1 Tax=Panagrellus redivivus TaxID=6233 RepID=A0A7E4VVK9_PANRE
MFAGGGNNSADNDPNKPKQAQMPSGVPEGYDPYNDPNNPILPIPVVANPVPSPAQHAVFGAPGIGAGPPVGSNNNSKMGSPSPGNNSLMGAPVVPSPDPLHGCPPPPFGTAPSPPAFGAAKTQVPKNLKSGGPGFASPQQHNAQGEEEQATPIKVDPALEEQDYYHGLLPREDIEAMLHKDGDFVIRVTEIKEGKRANRELCLSVSWQRAVHHFILRPSPKGKYSIASFDPGEPPKEFDTVLELVYYYMVNAKKFNSQKQKNIILLTPIRRQEWELRHESITCKVKLGAGAFGEVFAGDLKRKGKKVVRVAIKKLKTEKVDKAKILEIMHEARVMRPLKHRNVVRCYGVAADMEPLMILMELVNGGALDVYLKAHTNKVSLNERLGMCTDAAMGLEFVHSKSIMHRDIAARNCLYDGQRLKVSDFGLSVVGDKHQLSPNERAPVRWIAPEVFRTHIYTRPADVWAFGILIWEVFHDAQEPYFGWTGAQIRETVLQSGSPLVLPNWVGNDMVNIFRAALSVNPATRCTMSEIVQRMVRIAPRRQPQQPEDEDEREDDSSKRRVGGKTTQQQPRSAGNAVFKLGEKPKKFPEKLAERVPENDDKESSDQERPPKGGIGQSGTQPSSAGTTTTTKTKISASTGSSNNSGTALGTTTKTGKKIASSKEALKTLMGKAGRTSTAGGPPRKGTREAVNFSLGKKKGGQAKSPSAFKKQFERKGDKDRDEDENESETSGRKSKQPPSETKADRKTKSNGVPGTGRKVRGKMSDQSKVMGKSGTRKKTSSSDRERSARRGGSLEPFTKPKKAREC